MLLSSAQPNLRPTRLGQLFEAAARATLDRHRQCAEPDSHLVVRHPLATGWRWTVGGASKWTPGVGYLERAPLHRRYTRVASSPPHTALDDSDELALAADDDAATVAVESASSASHELGCTVLLSICYSPTFSVPVLWFEAHQSSGTPLSLEQVLRSTLFHDGHGLSSGDATPFVSQADHPATGRPSWFLHPCETEGIVAEVLEGGRAERGHEREGERRSDPDDDEWFASWLTVVGAVVDLRE
ncbi:hypothetical protein JCM3775_000081 [Rhodotorula graminis]